MKKYLIALFSLAAIQLNAQNFYNLDSIQTIEIVFSQNNWDQLLDAEKAGNNNYTMAQSVTINGQLFDSVGVKYKGNSSYNANQTKNPFHIELDTYKDHKYEAYTDIKLSNVANDPSFLREVLSYQILRQYMDAPLSNYANVYVNGILMGLYSNSESISKKFVDSRFNSKTNAFFNCSPPAGAGPSSTNLPRLTYLGTDSTLYYDGYEMKSDNGWQELIDLCDTLKNHVNDVEKILDVDRALWMLAFDNALVNLDSYIGAFAQNYYLYRDDNNRFLPIVWDLNESFGQFSMTGSSNLNNTTSKQRLSHLLNENDANYPLVQKLLSVPMYKRMYLAHYKTILLENFDNGSYYATAQALKTLISSSVQADVNKFYTYNNFLSNINSDVTSGGGPRPSNSPGITNLMDARSTYLLGLTDFTQTEPIITNNGIANFNPLINDTVTITAAIQNASTVLLAYRNNPDLPFVKVPMYDDGAHNDVAANDGIFGVDIVLSNTTTDYFIYAENSNIGKFSPVRAEHEFHTISATAATGDLVINEFMASNDTTVMDQNGKYDDWIELYNNGTTTIILDGYGLSDDGTDLMQWTFPIGTSIAPNAYLIVWADDDGGQAGLHANFKLGASGETLYLSDSTSTILDQITFPAQATDISYARFPNGIGNFQASTPTFNAMNIQTTGIFDSKKKEINLSVYPNPARDIFYLEVSEENPQDRITVVYNNYGKVVYEGITTEKSTINCSNWAKGMYVLRVGTSFIKLIVE